tara:strand:+ start:373 stop:684 length:312 start_codon:yes stop_codon:yes gene_type:complete
MTEFKGTPGEWIIHINKIEGKKVVAIASLEENLSEKGYPAVCFISEAENYTDRDQANAQLISKAPRLLEALKNLVNQIENEHVSEFMDELSEDAEQAIQEAIG